MMNPAPGLAKLQRKHGPVYYWRASNVTRNPRVKDYPGQQSVRLHYDTDEQRAARCRELTDELRQWLDGEAGTFKPGTKPPSRRPPHWKPKKQVPRYQAYAHRRVELAIQYGQLERPEICPRCGKKPKSTIHAHHEDYSKPLEVTWLCASCHAKRHDAIKHFRRRSPNAWSG